MADRMLAPFLAALGLIAGILALLSPFFVEGGIIGWLDSDFPDPGNSMNGFMWLLYVALSATLGLFVIIVSAVFAVIVAIAFAAGSATNHGVQVDSFQTTKLSNAVPSGDSNRRRESLEALYQSANKSDLPYGADFPATNALFCYGCGKEISESMTSCPYCNRSLTVE